jgi:hypothetical protein
VARLGRYLVGEVVVVESVVGWVFLEVRLVL